RSRWMPSWSVEHCGCSFKFRCDVPIVTRDDVRFAKPDPDLFLEAGKRLNMPMSRCVIVGDSVWDLLATRRVSALSVGLLSGGYGQDELERAAPTECTKIRRRLCSQVVLGSKK